MIDSGAVEGRDRGLRMAGGKGAVAMPGLRVLVLGQGPVVSRVSRDIKQAGHEVVEEPKARGSGIDVVAAWEQLGPDAVVSADVVVLPVEMATFLLRERERLLKAVVRLEHALEARKVIERAKGLLMEQYGLKEAEAYARMRQLAMDKRKPLQEIAEMVLALAGLEPGERGRRVAE